MAVLKPYTTNPVPLGASAPTAGTPVKITNRYTDLGSEVMHSIFIRSLPTNSGRVYILNSSSAADTTNYLNVIDVLTPGSFWSSSYYGMNGILPDSIYIDVQTTGDKAIASIMFE